MIVIDKEKKKTSNRNHKKNIKIINSNHFLSPPRKFHITEKAERRTDKIKRYKDQDKKMLVLQSSTIKVITFIRNSIKRRKDSIKPHL